MCLAIPALIQSVEAPGLRRHGCVSFGGAERRVDLSLVPDAGVGDYVMIHVGIALSVVLVLVFVYSYLQEDNNEIQYSGS